MQSKYNPKDFEDRIYQAWLDQKSFSAKVNPDKKPYTIVLPPPNITGQLHMGHALDQTLQDILIRFKRLQGYEALWLPGTDHASIATEVRVLKSIEEKEGIKKEALGREAFLERAWQWRDDYGRIIVNQMQKLGSSCDWDKERFTMDEGCNDAVTEVFVKLYEKGLIYRGNRLINWCPDCKTTLSDAEVEHEEKPGHFWHIKYPVKGTNEYLEIATTRPETMLADTAVAVNPKDTRYTHLVGKMCVLPLMNREIPIVADDYVDLEFGTGALKVTPAHDPNDFEIGQRHNLAQINILNPDATMNENAGKYQGLDRYACRKVLVEDLKSEGYLVSVKDHPHNVGTCYRCHTVIEPRVSDQWFVQMEPLAKPAIDVVQNKSLNIIPDRFTKVYLNWLENIRDWCISRQLWWGHRIPAYYCETCGEMHVAKEMPDVCTGCGGSRFRQDEDVLDTWFSSALWPFSTLGWPNKTPELDYFYPTNVLVTGYDIIFFWVIRMVFSGLELTDKLPFDHVFLHGLVRDASGKKMSKSLGNGVDPLEIIDQYGADALRFMLATGNSPGNDLKFQIERVEGSRNFANKLWNASRFVIMGLDNTDTDFDGTEVFTLADKWILSRLSNVVSEVTETLEKFELGLAAGKIYEFTWNEYCDWYIELAKKRLYGEDPNEKRTVQKVLVKVLKDILRALHPFMPFITEEIWRFMPGEKTLLVTDHWPVSEEKWLDEKAESEMASLMDAIRNIRNVRAEMDVIQSRKAKCIVKASDPEIGALLVAQSEYLIALASCSDVVLSDEGNAVPEEAVSTVIHGAELFLPLDDLVDYVKEMDRLTKEKVKLEKEVSRVVQKLANEGFVKKAPAHLIEEEKEKQQKYEEMLETVNNRIAQIEKKL
ncbi:valine--tRNA ligase [Fusibacter tunisiensis]|uniref:Valine--tRNA ligase n=1 Tax=Fusibacter tunisiensis TaxID=1008308 RepID=A0ABS2MSP1_9FIRM|nr:valine--tRNA ligase [Fusibacter tunisiensis]MBM7562307.1 valyl-tRNA synthetase [Fusibacter tunisiensis]